MTISTSTATPTTYDVTGGLDVDFSLTLPSGEVIEGSATMVPNQADPTIYEGYGGSIDTWIDGATVTRLRALAREERHAAVTEIADACSAECERGQS